MVFFNATFNVDLQLYLCILHAKTSTKCNILKIKACMFLFIAMTAARPKTCCSGVIHNKCLSIASENNVTFEL